MSQIITKGLLSSKLITGGYFGKIGQVIVGLVGIRMQMNVSSIEMRMDLPKIPMVMSKSSVKMDLDIPRITMKMES